VNKAELVEEVAGKVGLTKKEAGDIVDAITSAITDTLAMNERVTLSASALFRFGKGRQEKGFILRTKTILRCDYWLTK
jgi:nucleoid DNA-binding protein